MKATNNEPARVSQTFRLTREQLIPRTLTEVFEFFSNPSNLEAITPPWLKFRIVGTSTPQMQTGTTIDYRLRLHGLPLKWQSMISRWNPPFEFVDEQVIGPYRRWAHRHTFREVEGGVLMRDAIDYEVPGGHLVNKYFVRNDLNRIFDYRGKQLKELLA